MINFILTVPNSVLHNQLHKATNAVFPLLMILATSLKAPTVKPPSVVWKHSAMSSSRFSFRRKRQPRWKPAAWLCSSLHFRLISFQIILLPVINMGVFTQKSVFKGHITVVRKNRTVVFLCLVESKRRGGETWDSCHYFQERQPCEI